MTPMIAGAAMILVVIAVSMFAGYRLGWSFCAEEEQRLKQRDLCHLEYTVEHQEAAIAKLTDEREGLKRQRKALLAIVDKANDLICDANRVLFPDNYADKKGE